MSTERRARAAERSARIILRKTTLGDDCDPWPVSGADGISLVTALTRQAFGLASEPAGERDRTVRFVRRVP